ncbi:MAG: FHA domain-containing protein [Pyrinomonadaceae bacterium]
MGILESIRRWVDGEGGVDPLAAADEQSRPRRVWEEFLVKVAREVEAVMQREMFTPPGGVTYIPREYIVYLSADDDKDWQGDKRRGLEQGLFHVLSERARELSSSTQLAAKSFAVELRVDGTLNKGEFRVQPVWDEAETGHTMVTARPVELSAAKTSAGARAASIDGNENPNDNSAGESFEGEGEKTIVRARPAELYAIEIWREGVRESVLPISKPEITIGRGSNAAPVDLPLKGDPEVSRVHATLARDEQARYYLTAKGRNPTLVNNREITRDGRTLISPDDKIVICSFTLRIQPE